MMDAIPLNIPDVIEIRPRVIPDGRGYFVETFRQNWFGEHVSPSPLLQENQSLSRQAGTIRGLHFQHPPFEQGKLVRCAAGSIFDVAVDIRLGSPLFGKWAAAILTADACNQLWIPPGFLHGFCTLEPDTLVCYKVTNYYSKAHDAGVAYDDPAIGVEWPDIADRLSLSPKDLSLPNLDELQATLENFA